MTRDRLLAGGAACVLAVAALVALAPGILPETLVAVVRRIAEVVGPGGLAVLAGLIAVGQRLLSGTASVAPPPLQADDADDRGGRDARTVGEQFDQRLAAAARVDGRSAEAEAMVRADLRRLAVDRYRRVHDCDRGTAVRAVETGTWTDDTAAAAFVGGSDAPPMPLRVWVRDILSEAGAFPRGAARTVRALAALDPDDDADFAELELPPYTRGVDDRAPQRTDAVDGGTTLSREGRD